MYNVFAVIVTYNGDKWIKGCLSSLRNSSYPVKIIVVDNGSKDNTLQIIKNEFNDLILIQPEENLGFGRANNIGIKCALETNADYVFLLNQDAWVEKTTIEQMVTISNRYPDYGILSPIHLNGKGDALDLSFSKYVSPKDCPGFYSDLFFGKQKEIYNCKFVNAAAWLVTKECLKIVGGFNPFFFMYSEDNDFVQRLQYFRLKLGVVTGALAFHDREQRTEGNKELKIRRNYRTYSSLILFNIADPLSKAYLKFIRYSLSSFITLGISTCFPPFLEMHKEIFQIKRTRTMLKSKGEFIN